MGYGAAIASLFAKAREIGVESLVTFDADGQHRIDDIKVVLEPIIMPTIHSLNLQVVHLMVT